MAAKSFIDLFLHWTREGKSPTTYWEAAALSTLAACADRNIWYDNGIDILFPNLFIVLVGPPGTAKSTTIKIARKRILEKIEGIVIAPDEISRQQMYVEMEHEARRIFDKSPWDTDEYTSYNVFSTEWDTFIGIKDLEFLKILNKFYDCEHPFEYKTKHQGKNYLPNTFLNMIGDIQPEILPDVLPPSAIGTGFTRRIIFVVEYTKRNKNPRPKLDNHTQNELIAIAHDIYQTTGEMKLSKQADRIYMDWYDAEEYSVPLKGNARFAAYTECKPQHALKIAMLHSLSRTHGKSKIIEIDDWEWSLHWLNQVECNMDNAFIAFGQSVYAKITYQISNYIQLAGKTSVDKVLSVFWKDVSWSELGNILKTLEVQHKITQTIKATSTVIEWTGKDIK